MSVDYCCVFALDEALDLLEDGAANLQNAAEDILKAVAMLRTLGM